MEENTNDQENVVLTEQDVWDVIEFARALSGADGLQYLTPNLINARLKDINLNPKELTSSQLTDALKSPKENEKQLRELSQFIEVSSMVYKRMLSYLGNMLSFDITYTANVKPEDYNTKKYSKDVDKLEELLTTFNYKSEFKVAVREMLRNDAFFGCMRNTEDGWVLQELPSEYCKITARWDGGYLFSFDMYWFLQPGVDINAYPDFFKKKYKEIWANSKKQQYMPSLPPELRGKSDWMMWVDVPADIGVCFKLTPELATRLPYFTPLFNDLVLQNTMRDLQKNMDMAAASKLLIGEVPYLNKDTKSTIRDSISISPGLLGKFLALVRSSLSSSITVASAPLEDMKGVSFESDSEMYGSWLRNVSANAVNTKLLFSGNIKPNAIETQIGLNIDEQLMTGLYPQFETFLNRFINSKTKFRFMFSFEGTEFDTNRDKRLKNAMTLFDKGIVLPQKISASLGMTPWEMRRQMEEASAFNFVKNLTPPSVEIQREVASFQPQAETSAPSANDGTSKKRGRPAKDVTEVSEEGLRTKENASNVGRGGEA